jgi:hypothetical protein
MQLHFQMEPPLTSLLLYTKSQPTTSTVVKEIVKFDVVSRLIDIEMHLNSTTYAQYSLA